MTYWVKNTSGMSVLNRSLEPPLHEQRSYFTRNDRFFVCNSGTTPRINAHSHFLRICGDGISTELKLSYDELRNMPQRTVPALLECAGNHRSMYQNVLGIRLDKRPQVTELLWTLGGVGMAEWRGVPLRHVLERAGINSGAFHVCPKGSETDSLDGEIKIPMPVAKAMDRDTILALEMNGQPLPPDHGSPVRAIVPGWIGAYSVKWVREIEVSSKHLWVTRNTEFYVLMGKDWPAEDYAPALGAPITEQNLKSSLALSWPAKLAAGNHVIHGYARAPGSPVECVHWSDDDGETWHAAELTGPNQKYGWVRFKFQWRATQGRRILMSRATDRLGRTQPETVPFNTGGYLFNAIHPHPVDVV